MARFAAKQESTMYRVYVTDALKLIAENTAKVMGGSYISVRYWEILNPPIEDERTPEEITEYMLGKLRGGE